MRVLDRADVAIVSREEIDTGPLISGVLEPRMRAVARARIAGAILDIGPEVGQTVRRNGLLARIDAPALDDAVRSAEANVASAGAELEVAQQDVKRNQALVSGGALARRELERARSTAAAAEAKVGAARAQLASARSQLSDATVRSPMNGAVSRRLVNQGDIVTAGAELYEIIDPRTMRLQAWVASEQLGAIGVGKPVTFRVRGYPQRAFAGTIERIAPAADPATRQIALQVTIPNPSGELVAGLFADGRIASRRISALVVPLAVIDLSGEQPSVLRIHDGVAERVAISLGLRDEQGERVEVVRGLNEGDIVVRDLASRDLAVGARVVVPGLTGPAAAPPRA